MRIFVVGTGRCGTSTFYQACRVMTNYTAGHESKNGARYVGDWQFPDNHIEVASNLVVGLPQLLQMYPDAKWVHLVREDKEACIESLAKVCGGVRSFANTWWYFTGPVDPMKSARAYYEAHMSTTKALLPREAMTIPMERARDHWADFWKFIDAKGDFEKSQATWRRVYNPREKRGRHNFVEKAEA